MVKELKIVNLILGLIAATITLFEVGFPLCVTLLGGFFELLFTEKVDTFGKYILVFIFGSTLNMFTFILLIVLMTVKKKGGYFVGNLSAAIVNFLLLIITTIIVSKTFGSNLGEGSDQYYNLALIYGPLIFGGGICIVNIFISFVILAKNHELWEASFRKKNK